MLRAVADTHVVIWYLYDNPRLSLRARTFVEATAASGDEIGVSTITFIEMTYLIEKGRIPTEMYRRLSMELATPGAALQEIPVTRGVADAFAIVPRVEVPDMPDRIIAATAVAFNVPVISHDGKIRASGVATIW